MTLLENFKNFFEGKRLVRLHNVRVNKLIKSVNALEDGCLQLNFSNNSYIYLGLNDNFELEESGQ